MCLCVCGGGGGITTTRPVAVNFDQFAKNWNEEFCDGVTSWPKLPAHLRQYYTQWERADKAKQSMREIQDRMAEMRLQWQQDSESQHPGDDRAGVIVGEPTPVRRPAQRDANNAGEGPGISILPGTSTERVYSSRAPAEDSGPSASRVRSRPKCRKCQTVLANWSQLTANSDFTHFVSEVNQHREKKVIVEGRGYCKGSRSRCPRFKCKVFYKTNTGHTSKTNWRISNLKPRVHMDSCRKDHSCKCDNSDHSDSETQP